MGDSVRSIQNYYKHHMASVQGNLRRRGDQYLAGVDVQQLVEYYCSMYKLPEIALMDSREPKVIPDNPSSTRNALDSVPVTIRFDVEKVNKIDLVLSLENTQPKESESEIDSDENGFFVRTNLVLQNAKEIVEKYRQIVLQLVIRKNTDVRKGNEAFREQLVKIITERKSKLEIQTGMIRQLSRIIPIVQRSEPLSPVVPLTEKKQIVVNPPQPRVSVDPKVDPKILEAIIDVLVRGGRTFETAPETFAKLNEEDLRNILISFLNGNFELHAVAEAFNKLGKSDISLRYSGNNLFVAECKFWGGVDLYNDAIDQLFKYLTWRENIGVLIAFVRERDFTPIIRKSKESTSSHTTFIAGSLREKAASYFVTRHLFPEDKEKNIEIHHLLFTIHSPR